MLRQLVYKNEMKVKLKVKEKDYEPNRMRLIRAR